MLRSIPNATSVGFYPKEGSASVLNRNTVYMKLPGGRGAPHDSSAQPRRITARCSAENPNHAGAAGLLKQTLRGIVGEAAVDGAQRAVELRWTTTNRVQPDYFTYHRELQELHAQVEDRRRLLADAERLEEEACAKAAELMRAPTEAAAAARTRLEEALEAKARHSKRQRGPDQPQGSSSSSVGGGSGGSPSKKERPNCHRYDSYSRSTFVKLETEEQRRRDVRMILALCW